MAERLKAPVLKTGKGATLSWVRIPVSPPSFLSIDDDILYRFYNNQIENLKDISQELISIYKKHRYKK